LHWFQGIGLEKLNEDSWDRTSNRRCSLEVSLTNKELPEIGQATWILWQGPWQQVFWPGENNENFAVDIIWNDLAFTIRWTKQNLEREVIINSHKVSKGIQRWDLLGLHFKELRVLIEAQISQW